MAENIFTRKVNLKDVGKVFGLVAIGIIIKISYFAPISSSTEVEHTIEATKLLGEFRRNQAAAHLKYDGKLIEVNGKVYAVSMVGRAPVLSIGVLFTNVDCHLDSDMTEAASRFRSNAPVRVKGKAHAVGSDVFLKPCALV